MIRTVLCVTALVIAAGAASAQEDDPARMSARVDRPNVRRMFEDLRKTPRIERTPVARAVQAGSTQTSVWMLGGVIDRAVLVWFEIAPGSEQAVAQTGAITVTREQDITHHSIFKNRYYRLLPLAEGAPDDSFLMSHVGEPMKFQVGTRNDGRQVVVDVRRP